MLPRLPFFRQETPYSCVPACLHMVLAHWGVEADEDQIRLLLIDLRPVRGEIGRHAIVAENISETELQYLDPLTGRHVVELDAIDQAWRLNYRRVILIRSV